MENRPARRSILTNKRAAVVPGKYAEDEKSAAMTSVFRSPSVEERLAQLGISLSGGAGQGKDSPARPDESGTELGSARASDRLNSDISKRISGISSSMDKYDKKVKSVQEQMDVTYRNTIQNRRTLKDKDAISPGTGDDSSESVDIEADDFFEKCRASLNKDLRRNFDVPSGVVKEGDRNNNMKGPKAKVAAKSSPRDLIGLEAALLDSSGEELSDEEESSSDDSESEEESSSESSSSSSEEEEEEEKPMKVSIRQPVPPVKQKVNTSKRFQENLKGKGVLSKSSGGTGKNKKPEEITLPRSLSPVKPSMPDKHFQTMLERREERLSRHLTTMKNDLAQLNHKVEIDKKKAGESDKRGMMPHSYQGRPMRVLKPQSEMIGAELNAFIQSTGGPSGGWTKKDHSVFAKTFDLWRKHPNKLMETLKKDLPHKKSQDIAGHIKWYEGFEQLSSANRTSIHQWSQEKRRESELIYQMGSASQRARLEGDKRRQEHLRMVREQERDRGKEKLAHWKRAQAARTLGVSSRETREPTAQSPPGSAYRHAHLFQQTARFEDTGVPELRLRRPVTTQGVNGDLDIAGVRQHILDLTAKVHSLDKPKRDFRPPRASMGRREVSAHGDQHPDCNELQNLSGSRSVTNMAKPPTPSGMQPRIKLPGIEPEPQRPQSSSLRPPSASLIHQQQQRNRRLIQDFRERDSRIVEAKKKAVEIARDRRKTSLSQLTVEDVKRRMRSRVGANGASNHSTLLNPTKQSDLRKTITHLERLEMLSKQDLASLGSQAAEGGGDAPPMLVNLNNLPSKGIPSWRRSSGSGDYF